MKKILVTKGSILHPVEGTSNAYVRLKQDTKLEYVSENNHIICVLHNNTIYSVPRYNTEVVDEGN